MVALYYNNTLSMSKFLDVHSLANMSESMIRKLQGAPPDEFGVKQLNVLYNRVADLCFCFLEAPSKESVERHHEKYNVKCDWITEVQTLI
jgi:Protein of unknown function (DUF4242)